MRRLLTCGVGICDVHMGSNRLTSYRTWHDMLRRCFDPICQAKHRAYVGCSVCDEWLIFSNFKRWFDANHREGYHLDKDILVRGNKIYGPDTCCFVPARINELSTDRPLGRLPRGVRELSPKNQRKRRTTTYAGSCRDISGRKITKTFKTPEEAQEWYAETKRRVVREVAQTALDAGEIKQEVFDALVARTFVDISACRERGSR